MHKKTFPLLVLLYLITLGSALIMTGRRFIREGLVENEVREMSSDIDCSREQEYVWNEVDAGFAALTEEGENAAEDVGKANSKLSPDGDGETFDEREIMILERIVEAEAGGEDARGKLLVANVVLNRVHSEKFPGSIEEVVFQNDGRVYQFSPVGNGRYDEVSVSDETREAVSRVIMGEDVSEGALYFAARKYANEEAMRWFDENLTPLFQHGGHEFFK